ncbi:MAG TPA: molybdopterin oxidoreductase family protein [Chloroflexia bacterium]|nr:molybdopterin oxidoreductase family protein [Chloroflexia bacterium]
MPQLPDDPASGASTGQQSSTTRVVRGGCPHDCPDTCAWQVTVTDGVAVSLVGDPAHPFTRGGLCAKVNHYLERVYSPERVLYPLRRVGLKGSGTFERISWDEALSAITSRWRAIIAADGPTAILPYSYMGTQGVIQGDGMGARFFARLGATRLHRTICGATAGSGVAATIGSGTAMLPEDLPHSRFIILWGTNPIVTNLHLWPFVRQAQARGATVVVIDPLKTRTAAAADWHIRPLPGTDAALALGLMHIIVAEQLYDADYVAQHSVGFDPLRERLAAYPPDRVAALTGLPAEEIVRLARAYATTRPSTIRMLIGMEHRAHGAMTYRTIACLPALVGAWRERGGGLLNNTGRLHAAALNMAGVEMPELEDPTVRAINMVQLGQALTDATLAPPIRALMVYASNPAATAPNQQRVLAGLRREDLFTVVHEQFLTDTARYADYVLPATTQAEHLDLMWSWGHPYVTLNQPAVAPLGEAVPNSELFRRLAAGMGLTEPYMCTSDDELVRTALASDHPYLQGITMERLVRDGWAKLNLPEDWRPFANGNFGTLSGKCEFYSASLEARGIDPLPAYVPARESPAGDAALAARFPLQLLTAKSALHFLNSSYANLPRHLRAEGEPLLDMHPDDARPRGIADGDVGRIYNDRGTVALRVRVGDWVRPGVVAMPSGWWAALSPGGASANTLTADGLSDFGGGGDFHDTLVEVARTG